MDDNRAHALQLLREKEQLLLELETLSEQMLGMHVDELADAVKKRQSLLLQVQERDNQLRLWCDDDAPMREAMNQTAVPQEETLRALYQASLSVKAVANRILQGEQAIERHMQAERTRLKKKIEKLNQGGASVAKMYRKSMEIGHAPMYKKKSRNF